MHPKNHCGFDYSALKFSHFLPTSVLVYVSADGMKFSSNGVQPPSPRRPLPDGPIRDTTTRGSAAGNVDGLASRSLLPRARRADRNIEASDMEHWRATRRRRRPKDDSPTSFEAMLQSSYFTRKIKHAYLAKAARGFAQNNPELCECLVSWITPCR